MGQSSFNMSMPSGAKAITKSDVNKNVFNALYVGGAGDVVITDQYGNVTTFSSVPAGQYIWVPTIYVNAATTATNIVGIM